MMKKNINPYPPAVTGQLDRIDNQNGSLFEKAKKLTFCSTPEGRACLSFDLADRLKALPLTIIESKGKETLLVAAINECDPELASTLRFATNMEIKLVKADLAVLPQAIFIAYHQDQSLLQQQIQNLPTSAQYVANNDWDMAPTSFEGASGSPALLLAALIKYCLAHQASDLHLIPSQNGTIVSLRINGVMQQYAKVVGNKSSHEQLINRIKVLARLNTVKKRTPQDGALQIELATAPVSIRVSIMPTVHGQKAVLRFLGCQKLYNLENLGLDPSTYFFIERYLRKAQGAIIFAGATGSGKTTTMYALLEKLTGRGLNIVTIEDPVEIELAGISQTSLDSAVNLDYATCLRSVLRQDPDVILLGEIRDPASATTALQAALTGHALLSTVHARNVFEVFLRLHNLHVDNLTIAQAVQLVVCQKLLPCLCEYCKQVDPEASSILKQTVFKAIGCSRCEQSGYLKRALVTEALWVDRQLTELLSTETTCLSKLRNSASPACYHPIKTSLERLLKNGSISTEQYFDNLEE